MSNHKMNSISYQSSQAISLEWVTKKMPGFLFPDISKKRNAKNILMTGVLAHFEGRPIGLILGTRNRGGDKFRIQSLWVDPSYRNQGVGKMLIRKIQMAISDTQITSMELYFRDHWKSLEYLRKILYQDHWNQPQEHLVVVRGSVQKALVPFSDTLLAPADVEILNFKNMNQQHIIQIQQLLQTDQSLKYLNPLLRQETIHLPSSYLLLKRNQIIGWVVSHQVGGDLNEFTSLYLDPNYRSYKLAHSLMHYSIYSLEQSGVPRYMITVQSSNRIMKRFVLRYTQSANLQVTRIYKCEKIHNN